MTTCPHCKNEFPGLAAACPRCGRDLPPTGLLSRPTPPERPRMPTRARVIGLLAGILVGGAVLVMGAYIDFVLRFCLNLGFGEEPGTDPCADENRAMLLWFWFGVVPLSIASGFASGYAAARAVQRRMPRQPA